MENTVLVLTCVYAEMDERASGLVDTLNHRECPVSGFPVNEALIPHVYSNSLEASSSCVNIGSFRRRPSAQTHPRWSHYIAHWKKTTTPQWDSAKLQLCNSICVFVCVVPAGTCTYFSSKTGRAWTSWTNRGTAMSVRLLFFRIRLLKEPQAMTDSHSSSTQVSVSPSISRLPRQTQQMNECQLGEKIHIKPGV